jgi:2'-5' RNA ligase
VPSPCWSACGAAGKADTDGPRAPRARSSRLFVALWPDEPARSQLTQARDRWNWSASARPTPVDKLHVTLHFIGAVGRDRMTDVTARLGVPFDAFDLPFGRHALWRNGVAAFEPIDAGGPLSALHGAIGARLRALDLPVETRPYLPHVTMARDATGSAEPPSDETFVVQIGDYVLVESRPDGSYFPLALYPART